MTSWWALIEKIRFILFRMAPAALAKSGSWSWARRTVLKIWTKLPDADWSNGSTFRCRSRVRESRSFGTFSQLRFLTIFYSFNRSGFCETLCIGEIRMCANINSIRICDREYCTVSDLKWSLHVSSIDQWPRLGNFLANINKYVVTVLEKL